jgi:2-phospho-L-lactate guanylyltransferase
MAQNFSLLVPVKTLALAKSRLATPRPAVGGASSPGAHLHRAEAMRAFALDALAAAVACPVVERVYVVTDEPGFEVDGVVRLPDEGDGELNQALRHAARRARLADPSSAVAAMCADLPCLHAADLTAALGSGLSPRWFVADASGTGTTLLAAGRGVDLDPHFGVDSARRHEESGAVPVRADLATLRRDVDTDDDLAAARALGLGAFSAALLAGDARPL